MKDILKANFKKITDIIFLPFSCWKQTSLSFISICLRFISSLLLSHLLVGWRKRGKHVSILKNNRVYAGKVKSFTIPHYTYNGSPTKYEKQHFPQLSYTVLLSLQQLKGKKMKQSTRTRNKVWKTTVVVLNTKQEVLCSNPGKKTQKTNLFWSQITSSISSLMSNNKRRTLFSVRDFSMVFFVCLACRSPTHHFTRWNSSQNTFKRWRSNRIQIILHASHSDFNHIIIPHNKKNSRIQMVAPFYICFADQPGLILIPQLQSWQMTLLFQAPIQRLLKPGGSIAKIPHCNKPPLSTHVWWAGKVIWKGTSTSPARTLILPPPFAF